MLYNKLSNSKKEDAVWITYCLGNYLGFVFSGDEGMRRRNKIIIGVLLVVTIILVGFIVWAETPLGPMPEAYDALNSDSEVTVSTDRWLVFEPVNSSKNIGFIVYPGGRVDYRSYAPLAHAMAAEGFFTIIAPMPLNLAVFGVNAANDIINSYPEIVLQ